MSDIESIARANLRQIEEDLAAIDLRRTELVDERDKLKRVLVALEPRVRPANNHSCPECSRMFGRKNDMTLHRRKAHEVPV